MTIEPAYQLMRIGVQGFWTRDTMRAYLAELGRKVGQLSTSGGCRRILVDMSDYPLQSPEIAQGHVRIIGHWQIGMKAVTAAMMTSARSKLQAKRLENIFEHELLDDEVTNRA